MNQNISAEVSHKVTQREYSAVTARDIGLFLLALSTPFFASCGTLPAPTPEAPGEDAGDDGVAQEGRVEAPTVTEAEELAEKPAPTVTEVDEPTLEPTLVPLENADASVDRFGPSGIGKLTEVAESVFEDPAAVIESILENLKVAMLSAGEDPSGVIWEEVSIQAPQLVGTEGQGKFQFFLQVPTIDGQVVSFLGLAMDGNQQLIPVGADYQVGAFLRLTSGLSEDGSQYVISLATSDGTMGDGVIVIDLATGEAMLVGLFDEGGEASLGNLVPSDPQCAEGRTGLMSLVGISPMEVEMISALADPHIVLNISDNGNWQIFDQEQGIALWELVRNEAGELGWERVEAEMPIEAPVFIPEGFQVSELGLLQDPETGRDVLAMNPEADWERVREEIIGGLWLANMDWYQFTGEGSDAQNYSSKEAFIKAALEGQTFTLGIPVRADIDWGNVDKDVYPGKAAYGVRPSILFLKMVDGVRLDSINLQIMDADAFKDYMDGKGWLNPENEAYASYATPLENSAISTVNFSVDESGELVISTGSYYVGEYFPYSDEFLVGRFDGEEEIGSQADSAVSRFLGIAIHELIHFSAGELSLTGLDGTVIKYISLSRLDQDVPRDEWYVEPTLFTFAE